MSGTAPMPLVFIQNATAQAVSSGLGFHKDSPAWKTLNSTGKDLWERTFRQAYSLGHSWTEIDAQSRKEAKEELVGLWLQAFPRLDELNKNTLLSAANWKLAGVHRSSGKFMRSPTQRTSGYTGEETVALETQ